MKDNALSPAKLARGRSYSYRLLAGLFLEGITAARLPWIEAVDRLAAVLPRPFDPHEAAAVHYDLFAFHLHPYASLFLDASGLSGGPVAGQIAGVYRQAGFGAATDDTAVDHLGQLLSFLDYLAGLEAEAWERDNQTAARQWQARQGTFLSDYLLPWLFPCLTAVQERQNPFYTELTQLTLSLVMNHWDERGEDARLPLPVAPRPFDEDQAGLREMVRYLTTPMLSGIYCGRHDIGRIAQTLGLPRGFGGRETMLLNLFRSSGQYETAVPLLQQLGDLIQRWQTAYAQAQTAFPQAAPFIQPWQSRAAQTAALLRQGQKLVTTNDDYFLPGV
jgi:TorA maturation chaperone TorD